MFIGDFVCPKSLPVNLGARTQFEQTAHPSMECLRQEV